MLHVFQMDTGQMLTFDMTLLMETVSRLQVEIAKTTGISVDKQILILNGGQSLKPEQKVITYGAGADTNPVFLFSKLAIESQEPPLIRSFGSQKDTLIQLRERICDAMNMRPSFDTVTARTKLSVQIRDSANKILTYCNNEFKEQHLQYQGWGAVVANLEEIAQALERTGTKFCKAFQSFLPNREKNFTLLQSLGEIFELLGRVPLLESLKEEGGELLEPDSAKSSLREKSIVVSFHPTIVTLLDWISSQAQGQSLDSLQQKCFEDITMFNDGMFESYDNQVQELLNMVSSDKHQMKELVGIERRLSELEKRLNEAKKIARAQNDMAQGFIKHQTQLSSLEDAMAILPDLCKSHQHQLSQMLEGQQRIVALQTNFRNSKQEMSTNIHQRLGWVMHIETQIAKLDSELIFHMKTLRILEYNIDLLNQVKASPQVYAEMVVETTQRKHFAKKFTQWAEVLVEDSNQLYKAEKERRKQFSKRLGEHFLLHTLFKGFEDMPPNFATKVPRLFDASLPDITEEDISMLKSSVPELEESLSVGEHFTQFPLDQLSKQTRDSFEEKTPFSHQSILTASMTQSKPCVVTATEAPPTLFTLPELQESRCTEYLPALSSLTEIMTDLSTSGDAKESMPKLNDYPDMPKEKTADKHQNTKEIHISSCVEPECSKHHNFPAAETSNNLMTTQPPASGKIPSNTDSSSPLSSNEFATADFYFDDSMPSPMVESPSEKKNKGTKDESSPNVCTEEDVATLKTQLREKEEALGELRNLFKERETEVFKMQRQLNIGSSRSESTESTTLLAATHPTDSSQYALDGKTGSSETVKMKVKRIGSGSELSSLESSARVEDRVKDLEQKLEKLTADLELSKNSLLNAEQNLHAVQEQEQVSLEERNKLVTQLQKESSSKDSILQEFKERLCTKETQLSDLDKSLMESHQRVKKLHDESVRADKTLHKVKDALRGFALKTRVSIPALKKDLDEMRLSIRENSSQLDYAKMAALDILLKEKEKVSIEKEEMEQSLLQIEHDLSQEIKSLKSLNSDLSSELSQNQDHFAKKYAEQRYDFDSALRDMETKHALELEIELDKYKSETREGIEESERNYETLNNMKDCLVKELEEKKAQCSKTVKDLEMLHESNILEMEKVYMLKTEELKRKFEQTLEEHRKEDAKLKTNMAIIEENAKEREGDWKKQKEQMLAEHEDVLRETEEMMAGRRKEMDNLLENKQLDNANKLTELKLEFDMEKESLLARLKKFTDHSLINSQTQTGLELLSEVISLTSSDGSEEMNAIKAIAGSPEERDDSELGDLEVQNTQKKLEELTTQLNSAQETIALLNDEMKILNHEKQALEDELSLTNRQEMTDSKLDNATGISKQMQMSTNTASFILMDKEQTTDKRLIEEMKTKNSKISQLEKSLMEMSITSSEKFLPSDKVSIKGCDKGDLVLLCLDERHDQYVVFTVGTNLHFLHSDSLEGLGIKPEMEPSKRKSWILAEVVDKEYCLAKKPNNRFRVPQGTCFYRVKCQPWKCDFDAPKQEPGRKSAKKEQSETSSKAKK